MRNKLGSLLWGIVFIIVGVGFAGNAIGWWNFDLFFDGWWTLFIIVPCAISIIQNRPSTGNLIGLGIGVMLLLSSQEMMAAQLIRRMIIPIILVAIGIGIIFRPRFKRNDINFAPFHNDPNMPKSSFAVDYTAIFGSCDKRVVGEKFFGADITAIFGGVDLNLREAIIEQDVVIGVTAIFGGVDILLPPNVKVKVAATPIFGGVSNHAVSSSIEGAPTVYINATCIFGGSELK